MTAMVENRTERVPYYVEVAGKLVKAMETGTSPWQKPWDHNFGLPENGKTGNHYRGLNAINLLLATNGAGQSFSDPRWLTFKQTEALGGQVRKGERGVTVQFWENTKRTARRDENGEPILGADGKPEYETVKLDKPIATYARVFNAEQIDGLAPYQKPEITWSPTARAEQLLSSLNVKIRHDGVSAYYRPSVDEIHLPARESFASAESYYATALHEMAHATGHETRLNRNLVKHPKGSDEYAREELRAEIASMLLSAEIGLPRSERSRENGEAYAASWAKALTDHPAEILSAAKDAEQIREYVMARAQELLSGQTVNNETAAENVAAKAPVAPQIKKEERLYLRVGFADKDAVKALGAKFDSVKTSWYCVGDTAENREKFARFVDPAVAIKIGKEEGRTYLQIRKDSPDDKQAVKAAGAQFDAGAYRWYVPAGVSKEKFAAWIAPEKPAPNAALDVREEASKKMAAIGFAGQATDLIADGNNHRCAVAGDKPGEQSGFYVIHPDGLPNVYATNNRTKETVKEKLAGAHVSREEMREIKAAAELKIADREKDAQAQAAATAQRCAKKMTELPALVAPTPYMERKGITVHRGVAADDKQTLNVPLYDANGAIKSMCYINADGSKRFAKGGEKRGNFHVIDAEKLADAKAIIISEGYATAATIKEAVGDKAASVAAFDCGNLKAVAETLRDKYPDKPMVIAADNDLQLKSFSVNPGLTHAKEAAAAVGATFISPGFPPEVAEKSGSDFNDLARIAGVAKVADILEFALAEAREKTAAPEIPEAAKEQTAAREESPTQAAAEAESRGSRGGASR